MNLIETEACQLIENGKFYDAVDWLLENKYTKEQIINWLYEINFYPSVTSLEYIEQHTMENN